jgi:hypothetical protein
VSRIKLPGVQVEYVQAMEAQQKLKEEGYASPDGCVSRSRCPRLPHRRCLTLARRGRRASFAGGHQDVRPVGAWTSDSYHSPCPSLPRA